MSEIDDRFRELRDAYADYTVYDEHYERIGRVDDLFVDGDGREQYIGVKMGTFGAKSTLIPMDRVRVNDLRQLVEVAAPKETIENAPNFDENEEISPDLERRIHAYFGGPPSETLPNASDYFQTHHTHDGLVDTEYGERAEVPLHPPESQEWIDDASRPDEPLPEESSEPVAPPPEDRSAGQGIRVHRLRRE